MRKLNVNPKKTKGMKREDLLIGKIEDNIQNLIEKGTGKTEIIINKIKETIEIGKQEEMMTAIEMIEILTEQMIK